MRKASLSVAALTLTLLAQAQQDTATRPLDEVVVTATKYPLKLSQTGKVLSVINRETIERNLGKDLPQLLTEQTSILVNGAFSNPGKDKSLFLRGASNDYTLILLDGVPVNDPSGVGGALDLRLLPLDNIERIEILKGSQSTLYGADAVAGVINIITRKAGPKAIGGFAGASYGSYNTVQANAGVNGRTSALDYNVNYNYTETDGISEALDTTKAANFDKDGFRRHSLQTMLTFHAGKKLHLSPFYRYTWYGGNFDADAFTDADTRFSYLLNNTGALAKLDLPGGSLNANYGYTFAKRDYTYYNFRGRFQNADVYIDQRLGDEVRLLGGVNYQAYRLLDSTLPVKDPKSSIISPYLSFFIQGGNGLNLEVGGRYNRHSKFGSHLTYSFSASYLPVETVKFFANVSTGFKAPTVTELFGLFGANPDLRPEQSRNLEGGVQADLLKKKLSATATVFDRDITNLIAYLGQYVNVDEQHDRGFELEAKYQPAPGWNLTASYMYVTGNITQARSGKDTSYYNLIRRPKHTVSASAGWQVTPAFYASLSVQSLGDRTDLYFQPVPPYATEQIALKSYAVLNAYAEYKLLHNRLRLFVDARNLTDTDFTEVYGYTAQGLNVTGGFRIHW